MKKNNKLYIIITLLALTSAITVSTFAVSSNKDYTFGEEIEVLSDGESICLGYDGANTGKCRERIGGGSYCTVPHWYESKDCFGDTVLDIE